MSDVHAAQEVRHYSAPGIWGAVAGLVASLIAWHRQDLSVSSSPIVLYVVAPLVFLALAVAIPRIPYRTGLPVFMAALCGFVAFCYGMFLLLLLQHVV